MHKKLHVATILFAILPVLSIGPACSKKSTTTKAPEAAVQQEDATAREVREQLEKERQQRETEANKLRAEKIKFMYEDIYFTKGSYKLTPQARELLQRKALWMKNNPDINVIVEGHTNEASSKEFNFSLGDHRAGAVKSFLIGQGIASSRLIAVSYGDEKPIDTGKTEMAKEKNRRVHFVVEE